MTSLKDWFCSVVNTGIWHRHFVNAEEENRMQILAEDYIMEIHVVEWVGYMKPKQSQEEDMDRERDFFRWLRQEEPREFKDFKNSWHLKEGRFPLD